MKQNQICIHRFAMAKIKSIILWHWNLTLVCLKSCHSIGTDRLGSKNACNRAGLYTRIYNHILNIVTIKELVQCIRMEDGRKIAGKEKRVGEKGKRGGCPTKVTQTGCTRQLMCHGLGWIKTSNDSKFQGKTCT